MDLHLIYFKIFYLFIFRERGREGEREGQKHHCVVASRAPPTMDGACNPARCPRLGLEPATPWFTGWHSIHWATAARDGPPFCSISCSSAALAHVRLEPLYLPGGSTLSSLDNTPSQSPVISLVPWSPLSDPNIATPPFLWLMFTRLPFFIL